MRDERKDDQIAARLGAAAFAAGRIRVPALDPDLCAHLANGTPHGVLAALESWLHAWDSANLAPPADDGAVALAELAVTINPPAETLTFERPFSLTPETPRGKPREHQRDLFAETERTP